MIFHVLLQMFVDKFAIFSLNRLSVGIADLTLHTSTNKDQISIRQELLRVVVWAADRPRLA